MKLFKQAKGLLDIKARRELLEGDPNINVTKAGAFKAKKRKPGQNTKGGAMPDIFKLQRPLLTTEQQPLVLVYNQDRTWEGQIPLTPELQELFGDQDKVYIMAIPSDQGQLTPLYIMGGQDW